MLTHKTLIEHCSLKELNLFAILYAIQVNLQEKRGQIKKTNAFVQYGYCSQTDPR